MLLSLLTYPVSLLYTGDELELIQRSDAETSLKLAFSERATSNFHHLATGYASFPPLWSLGLSSQDGPYKSQKEVLQIWNGIDERVAAAARISMVIHMDAPQSIYLEQQKVSKPRADA